MSLLEREVAGGAATVRAHLVAWSGGHRLDRDDTLAVEEPLEIRLAGCSVAVTMRTPGHDLDLAVGFLYTEGIIRGVDDLVSVAHCPSDDGSLTSNIVNVNPGDPSLVDPDRWRRNFFATSSCGLCGKASIASIRQEAPAITGDARVGVAILYELDQRLCEAQAVFSRTGGLHAAALFDLQGNLLALREDVGRHNAVDKVIGAAVRLGRVPLSDRLLLVSGRASFEIVQKALVAGIPIVAAVSAPSSLAVDLAGDAGMTLLGFLRSDGRGAGRVNVYTGAERVVDGGVDRGG
jgi:FdhD protein